MVLEALLSGGVLETLDLGANGITGAGFDNLLPGLTACPSLKTLEVIDYLRDAGKNVRPVNAWRLPMKAKIYCDLFFWMLQMLFALVLLLAVGKRQTGAVDRSVGTAQNSILRRSKQGFPSANSQQRHLCSPCANFLRYSYS